MGLEFRQVIGEDTRCTWSTEEVEVGKVWFVAMPELEGGFVGWEGRMW